MNNFPNGVSSSVREYLQIFFKKLDLNAYYFASDPNAQAPYIVYELRPSDLIDDSGNLRRFMLEIDIYTKNSVIADNIMDSIDGHLRNLDIVYNCLGISGFFGYNSFLVPENIPLIHKRTTYMLHVYFKS